MTDEAQALKNMHDSAYKVKHLRNRILDMDYSPSTIALQFMMSWECKEGICILIFVVGKC